MQHNLNAPLDGRFDQTGLFVPTESQLDQPLGPVWRDQTGQPWPAQDGPLRTLSLKVLKESMNMALVERGISSLLRENALTQEIRTGMHECLQALKEAVGQLGPHWMVKPFGSCATGFCTRHSDIDAACYREGAEEDNLTVVQALRTQLRSILQEHARFEIISEIWTARVPIIKLRYNNCVEVDLSCYNNEALKNTQLLQHYAKIHPVVRQLVVAIKLWAKAEGVVGAPSGHLSSYSFALMVIYFMQVDPWLQFPCLPPSSFDGTNEPAIPVDCKLEETLSALIARFFHFYCCVFCWGREVVSVRMGSRIAITERCYWQLASRGVFRLHIEDPFLLGRNLNCVLGGNQEQELRSKLVKALEELHGGLHPSGLQPSVTVGPEDLQTETKAKAAKAKAGKKAGAKSTPKAAPKPKAQACQPSNGYVAEAPLQPPMPFAMPVPAQQAAAMAAPQAAPMALPTTGQVWSL